MMVAELLECGVCKSVVLREQVDGECYSCSRRTCANCRRTCDRCQKIFCMFDVEVKLVMRQQQVNVHKLCEICRKTWM